MDLHSPFAVLMLITLLAVTVPVLVSRIRPVRLPIVVGEIVAGIIIGQSGLNLVQPNETLNFLAEFGFVFLMFLSGLEVDLSALAAPKGQNGSRPAWQRPIPLASLIFILTVVLAIIIGFALSAMGLARSPIMMGLILSTTSLGIVVPVLKERQLTITIFGQVILIAALISDFVTLFLLSFATAIYSQGLSLNLLLFMVLLAIFATFATISKRISSLPFLNVLIKELSHATSQIQVRGAFALMIAWVVLAEFFGIEVVLGAFLAGVIISVSSGHHESTLREKLDAIGFGFFIPIFFIMVGANFDIRAIFTSPGTLLLVPILIISAFLVKMLPSLLFKTIFSWRETLAAGALLSSRLSLIIAASAIALELQLITPATNSAIILVAVITCTFAPILFARILPAREEVERKGVIIYGMDQIARLLAERLRRDGEEITFIGGNGQEMEQLQRDGYRVVPGNPADLRILEEAGATHARGLMAVANEPQTVLAVCRQARDPFAIPSVVARVSDRSIMRELRALDVYTVEPAMATALALEGALLFPASYTMMVNQYDNVDLLDVVLLNNTIIGQSLRSLRLPGNALVLGIRREGEVVVPHGDTMLQQGDILMLVGSPEAIHETQALLEMAA